MNKPTNAYIGATWVVLFIGIASFLAGIWQADILLSEKGFYLAVIVLGLYSAISLQKTVRDKAENLPVSNLYYMISWAVLFVSVALIFVGLWNAQLTKSEKGFYGIAFTMSLFAVITVQKNIRDLQNYQKSFGTKPVQDNDEF